MIEQELERRGFISRAIDAAIRLHFIPIPVHPLKRGRVQETILKELSLERTTELCRIINERMRAAGYRTVTRHGAFVYKI